MPLALAILAALGPEIQVSPNSGWGFAADDQSRVHLCAPPDGGVGLLAWEDYRCGRRPCVLASRISAAGQLLDPAGLQLSPEGNRPRIGCGARQAPGQFLVTWHSATSDVWANTVSGSGLVSAPFSVYRTGGSHHEADICTDGDRYLVAWADNQGTDELYSAVLEADGGTVVAPHAIASLAGPPLDVRATWSGGEYLVAWAEGVNTPVHRGMRVSQGGNAMGAPVTFNPMAWSHDVAFAGAWVIAWQDGPSDVWVRWLDPMLNPRGADLKVNTPGSNGWAPELVTQGGRIWLAWGQDDDRLLVSEQLGPADAGPVTQLVSGYAGSIALAPSSTGFTLAAELASNETDLFVQQFSPSFVSMTGQVPIVAVAQLTPAVAALGDVYLVVWRQELVTESAILGRRVNREGALLDPNPIPIASSASSGSLRKPQVVTVRQTWFVVWFDDFDDAVRARRYALSGVALDATPLTLVSSGGAVVAPGLGTDGTQVLLAWINDVAALQGQRFSSAGAPLGMTQTIATMVSADPTPYGVAGSDAGFVVTWHDVRTFAARVTPTGTLLDPGGFTVALAGHDSTACSDGERFHIAYAEATIAETPLEGAMATFPAGVALSPGLNEEPYSAQCAPLGGSAGAALVGHFAYKPAGDVLRRHELFLTYSQSDAGWDPPINLSDSVQQVAAPRLAAGSTSRAYVWSRTVGPPTNAPEVVIRIETLALGGEACVVAHDCAGGDCVAGSCTGMPKPDGGPPDAGPPDGGPPDSGAPDSGPPDAGPGDGGPVDGGPGELKVLNVGCGCAGAPELAWLLWASLLLAARKASRRDRLR